MPLGAVVVARSGCFVDCHRFGFVVCYLLSMVVVACFVVCLSCVL